MKGKSRIAAVLLAGAAAVSFASCGADTTWVARNGEDVMPAGVYIVGEIDSYYDAEERFAELNPDMEVSTDASDRAKVVLGGDIDGKTGAQYISDRAMERVKNYFAVEKICRERGIALTEADESMMSRNNDSVWSYTSAFYERNGVSRESLEKMSQNYMKQNLLLENLYGEGGERAISDADYEAHYRSTRTRVRYIPFSLLNTETGEALSEEDAQKVRDEANAYLGRAKDAEEMAKLLIEHETAVNGEAPEDTAPGAYDMLLTEDSTSPSQEFVDEMRAAAEGEAHLIENGNTIYVAMRVDPMSGSDVIESLKSTMLREIAEDEFDAWLIEQGNALSITFNDAALKRYTPSKINFKA